MARMFLMKCYYLLQNARVTAFAVSELLRETQQWWGGGVCKITPTTQIRVKRWLVGKEGSDLFEEVGCNFYIKNKLKSKKFNDKKVDKQK